MHPRSFVALFGVAAGLSCNGSAPVAAPSAAVAEGAPPADPASPAAVAESARAVAEPAQAPGAAPAAAVAKPISVAATAQSPAPIVFGSPLKAASDLEFGQLLAEPDKYASTEVTVQGVVRQVCQMRGCWLELATDTAPEAGGCRVISQGHAFFVPIDSAGKRARVQGRVEVRDVPAAQVAHMEREGGRFANKQPDGSAKELRIVATGVELASRAP